MVEQNKIVHIHFANGVEYKGQMRPRSFLARLNVWDYPHRTPPPKKKKKLTPPPPLADKYV